MNKKRIIAVAGVACVAGLYFVIPDSEPEYVAPVQKEAPQGYQYNRSNNLIPIVEAKTLANKRSFFNDMRLDAKKGLDKYGLGLAQELKNIRVRENIITGKPTVRFIDSNANKENVELTPPGLVSGLVYTGKSNLNRERLDQLAYGAISEWLGTEDPYEIGKLYFGEGFDNAAGFTFSILDFQRQLIVSKYKLQSKGFPYQSVVEEYTRLRTEFIDKDKVPTSEDLVVFEGMVMNNVKNLSNFAGLNLKKMVKGDSDEVALMLIEFFIYEDVRLLNSLKTSVKLIVPAPSEGKFEKRMLREQQEMKAREREAEETRRQEMLIRRTGGR